MEYSLVITHLIEIDASGAALRSKGTAVQAEADLGKNAEKGFPDVFFGKLLDVSAEQILKFKFDPEVQVDFRGSGYRFEELEISGLFKLKRGY